MIYRFSRFEIDTDRLELLDGDTPVTVEPQVFSLLAYLIENRDRVLTKDEIIEHVWQGRIVSDSSLNTRINAARRAVGDNGSDQAIIRTYPRRGFRFVAEMEDGANTVDTPALHQFNEAPELSDKPSIAVLPFENMSGDPEQEYFSDGLTEDIITALSLWHMFPVIARNSTFTYKGQAVKVQEVANELGARYVIEGSVRKSGERVRVAVQLIDAETGHHVWSERYDRELADIFDLQDEITECIAAIVEPEIERSERKRIVTHPPSNLAAWELCLRGDAYIYEGGKENNNSARDMFERAIELDPHFARAHTGLAYTYARDLRFFGSPDRDEWQRLLAEAARRAVGLDESDSDARTMLVRVYNTTGQPDAAIAEARRAVDLNPNNAMAHNILGAALSWAGRYDEGIPCFARALRLNPRDPQQYLFTTQLAIAHLGAGHYTQARQLAEDAIRRRPEFLEARICLASALGYLGQTDLAAATVEGIEDTAGEFVEGHVVYAQGLKAIILDGLRRAGWEG